MHATTGYTPECVEGAFREHHLTRVGGRAASTPPDRSR